MTYYLKWKQKLIAQCVVFYRPGQINHAYSRWKHLNLSELFVYEMYAFYWEEWWIRICKWKGQGVSVNKTATQGQHTICNVFRYIYNTHIYIEYLFRIYKLLRTYIMYIWLTFTYTLKDLLSDFRFFSWCYPLNALKIVHWPPFLFL